MLQLKKLNRQLSTRKQINIRGIQDSVLILPGNRFRAILQVSSVNFELKSEAEKDALIEAYESFLNSITFEMQFIVRIRELDIDKHLASLNELMKSEKTQIYKSQINDYIEFLKDTVKDNKVLERNFYAVVTLNDLKVSEFDAVKEQLDLRCEILSKGLTKLGIKTTRLSGLALLNLFYEFYNPTLAKVQPISDQILASLNSSYIRGDSNVS